MFNLRPYQQRAVNVISDNLNKGVYKQCITSATGSGKTRIASEVIKLLTLENKRVFFVVAGEPLVIQTYNTFVGNKIQCSVIKAGMEKLYNEHIGCQILMIQTFTARQSKLPSLRPDVIIIDEVDYGYNGGMLKNLLVSYPDAQIVGLTATPLTDKGYLLPDFDFYYNVESIKELQKQGYLSLDQYIIPFNPDLSNVKIKKTGDYNEDELEAVCNQATIIDDIVRTYQQFDKGYKILTFAISIKHAESLQRAFNTAGITCGLVHSKMKKQDVKYWLNEYKNNRIRMMVSVGIIIRGFDAPDVIDIIDDRPTLSRRLQIQKLGRGARPDSTNYNFFRVFDYAGNVERHGTWSEEALYFLDKLPQIEREWKGIICPNPDCFAFITKKVYTCPNCGNSLVVETEKKERELEEIKHIAKMVEYQETTVLEDLNEFIGGKKGTSYYFDYLYRLKPSDIKKDLFDTEVKRIVKFTKKKGQKYQSIYYKVKEKFDQYRSNNNLTNNLE